MKVRIQKVKLTISEVTAPQELLELPQDSFP